MSINDDEISADEVGSLLAQVLLQETNGEESISLDQKIFWLEVADIIGAERAQGLYHATVFMTRNA